MYVWSWDENAGEITDEVGDITFYDGLANILMVKDSESDIPVSPTGNDANFRVTRTGDGKVQATVFIRQAGTHSISSAQGSFLFPNNTIADATIIRTFGSDVEVDQSYTIAVGLQSITIDAARIQMDGNGDDIIGLTIEIELSTPLP
jgi:hypothetical protein